MGGNEQQPQPLMGTPDQARRLDPIDTIHGFVPIDNEVPTISQGYSEMDPKSLRHPEEMGYIHDAGKGKIYDKKELGSLIDALNRIGISELALPPEFLGVRYAPKNYVLPKYPTNSLPEDVRFSL
jgi:hypothetical protein